MFKQAARLIVIHVLMLLGAATAWAGRGDVDPNYGEGGQLAPGPGNVLTLPDGRLLIDTTDTGDAFKVRLVDAYGHDDQAFGASGHASIPTPVSAPWFFPVFATLGPDGEIYVEGLLWAEGQARFFEAILRLDASGRPELSFGGQGDAFFRLTDDPIEYTPNWMTTLVAFTVDPVGRIVIAQHGWTSNNACGGPMAIRRFLPNSEPDPAFGTAGSVEIPDVDPCANAPLFGWREDGGVVAPLFGVREDGGIVVGDGRTIVAIDRTGAVDAGFGAAGSLYPSDSGWTAGFLLPDESLLIFSPGEESTGTTAAILAKFDRYGQVDSTFGSGTGVVQLELSVDYPEATGARGVIDRLLLAPDGTHLLAQMTLLRADGSRHCVGIARFSIDGMLDDDFGRHGLTCLDHGAMGFFLIAAQGEGAPVFQLDGPQNILRLLSEDVPSPGMITGVGGLWSSVVDESAGAIDYNLMRVAGHDGAVSIDYSTSETQFGPGDYYYREPYFVRNATAGADYEETSGQLEWANGEDGERVVRVTIVDDSLDELSEVFRLTASNPVGGAMAVGTVTLLGIRNDDAAPLASPNSDGSANSGGGSLSTWVLLALLTFLFMRRRCFWC
jgi:hypothetical protein